MDWVIQTFQVHGDLIQTVAIVITVIIAMVTIQHNNRLARKRATIDLVLHQRTDIKLIEQRDIYKDAREGGNGLSSYACKDQSGHATTSAIFFILNNYEFIAAGIRQNAFDEKIYKRMYCGMLLKDYMSLKAFITETRKTREHETLFQEFMWLGERWTHSPLKPDIFGFKPVKRFLAMID